MVGAQARWAGPESWQTLLPRHRDRPRDGRRQRDQGGVAASVLAWEDHGQEAVRTPETSEYSADHALKAQRREVLIRDAFEDVYSVYRSKNAQTEK